VPRTQVLHTLIKTAYLASLRTEEGRFVRGSLTFSDPQFPDIDPPLLRRANYPNFTMFAHRIPLTVEVFAKLSRAIDQWSGSIAVYGTNRSNVVVWGVVDQIVHENVRRNRESRGGFNNPGILTITVDAVGELSIYHGNLFLGGVRQDQLIIRMDDALRSEMVAARVLPTLAPLASRIATALRTPKESSLLLRKLFEQWSDTVARLCIGLRRLGTGGAFLISPSPIDDLLDVSHAFSYHRLGQTVILRVLDDAYLSNTHQQVFNQTSSQVPITFLKEITLAEADSDDRALELTGAVRLVTSLAAVDGLVLLGPTLTVIGFGVKIKSESKLGKVYDGPDFTRRGKRAKIVDLSSFGTRHASMLRYCRADNHALGLIVSQDGHVRLIMSAGRYLTLWNNIQLLDYQQDFQRYAKNSRRIREHRKRNRRKTELGYTLMPKTLRALLRRK